ncbi:MAG: nuclear transport factor 2 family protein [Burkholderiaceae bacterium]
MSAGSTDRRARLVQLAETYFAAVDRMDLGATLACFSPEARFTIATFGTVYRGRETEIRSMFERLNGRYAQVWHGAFDHVVEAPHRIASRFRVENTTFEGQLLVKNNCNFFGLRGDLFAEVFVYMSGDNSLG